MRFHSKKKTPVAQKHPAIFRQEKMHSPPSVGLSWDSPPPPPESVRADVRALRWRPSQNFSDR